MREIKFRAWDNVLGLCSVESIDFAVDCVYVRKPIDKEFHTYTLSVENSQLMQYTGLHDKNGKEIYEGDIVTDDEYIGVVYWHDYMGYSDIVGYLAWCVGDPKKPGNAIKLGSNGHHPQGYDWTILGNIYENPELIEKS